MVDSFFFLCFVCSVHTPSLSLFDITSCNAVSTATPTFFLYVQTYFVRKQILLTIFTAALLSASVD
jgi:hypothetical protein